MFHLACHNFIPLCCASWAAGEYRLVSCLAFSSKLPQLGSITAFRRLWQQGKENPLPFCMTKEKSDNEI